MSSSPPSGSTMTKNSPCCTSRHLELPSEISARDSSPNNSPIVMRSKKRILEQLSSMASHTFDSLVLQTPAATTTASRSVTTAVHTGWRKSKTMPVGEAILKRVRYETKAEEEEEEEEKILENGEILKLPYLSSSKDAIKRISCETLSKLIEGQFQVQYEIIDCRFQYEFEGGHVRGAINLNTQQQVQQYLFDQEKPKEEHAGKVLIFHCEYSSHRAPKLALFVRSLDRMTNGNQYPNLHYPQIYILEGGYREFFSQYKECCEPEGYIEMHDTQYAQQLKTEKLRRGGSFLSQQLTEESSLTFCFEKTTTTISHKEERKHSMEKIRKSGYTSIRSWSKRF